MKNPEITITMEDGGVIRAEYPNEKPALLAAAQKIIAS